MLTGQSEREESGQCDRQCPGHVHVSVVATQRSHVGFAQNVFEKLSLLPLVSWVGGGHFLTTLNLK